MPQIWMKALEKMYTHSLYVGIVILVSSIFWSQMKIITNGITLHCFFTKSVWQILMTLCRKFIPSFSRGLGATNASDWQVSTSKEGFNVKLWSLIRAGQKYPLESPYVNTRTPDLNKPLHCMASCSHFRTL